MIPVISQENRGTEHIPNAFSISRTIYCRPVRIQGLGFHTADAGQVQEGQNSIIRMEIGPTLEYTKDFNIDDWEKLWDDFMGEFDNIELFDKNGSICFPKTNLKGSKGVVRLIWNPRAVFPPSRPVLRINENGWTCALGTGPDDWHRNT